MTQNTNLMKKNIKIMGYGLWVMVALLVSAPTMAQNYEAQQPTATFQSTSTFTGSGSTYSSDIQEVGAKAPGHPGQIRRDGPGGLPSVDPSQKTDDPTTPQYGPIGDAVLPLLLMAMGFAGVIALRRKRKSRV